MQRWLRPQPLLCVILSVFFRFFIDSYFKEDRLLSVKNNNKEKKIILAVFEEVSVENQGYEEILLNKTKVDISGGTGTGSSYQPDTEQLKGLVQLCDNTIFGHGSLGDENTKRSKCTCLFCQHDHPS